MTDRLRARSARSQGGMDKLDTEVADEIERLQQEVLRLRAALHTIAGRPRAKPPLRGEMIDIARVALNEGGKDIVQSIIKRDRM